MGREVRDQTAADEAWREADVVTDSQRRLWLAVRRALYVMIAAIETELGIEPRRCR